MKRHLKLMEIKSCLKSNLFGLDSVIDQVVDSMTSWYFYPEYQSRPLILNLWGMTGVGKSDLVRQLVEALDMQNNFFQFDMGELGYDSTGNIRSILSDSYLMHGSEPRVILLDEFQLCRSVNEDYFEVPQKEMRVIWQLLDNGKVNYLESMNHVKSKINLMISKLDYWVQEGMTVQSGMINSEFFAYFDDNADENNTDSKPYRFIFDDNELMALWEINRKQFPQIPELKKYILTLDTIGIQKLLIDSLKLTSKPIQLDFSQSLIFVVGNLDEAFSVTKDLSPDISPDLFHQTTSKIKLPDIKLALLKRFRAEQIGRLGNNHIIYPSLDKKAYFSIIDFDLSRIARQFNSRTSINLTFDDSVREWIFQEGVIPTQGVRPLKSSIKYGLEDLMPKLALHYSTTETPLDQIHLKYEKTIIAQFKYQNEIRFEKKYLVLEKIKSLKENRKDDRQALVAVHESGHAIAYLAFSLQFPGQVCSVAAGAGIEGFISTEPMDFYNFQSMRDKVCVLLAGQLAEREVFGSDLISGGSSSDIKKATEMTMAFFKECGFAGSLVRTAITVNEYDYTSHQIVEIEEKAVCFIEGCQEAVEKLLKREKDLLIQMAQVLANQPILDKQEVEELVKNFASDSLKQELQETKPGYRELLFSKELIFQ
ncbi:MAG: AAA family ATPase [Bacteroidota bacterium]